MLKIIFMFAKRATLISTSTFNILQFFNIFHTPPSSLNMQCFALRKGVKSRSYLNGKRNFIFPPHFYRGSDALISYEIRQIFQAFWH